MCASVGGKAGPPLVPVDPELVAVELVVVPVELVVPAELVLVELVLPVADDFDLPHPDASAAITNPCTSVERMSMHRTVLDPRSLGKPPSRWWAGHGGF
jgi:hypothetical protein